MAKLNPRDHSRTSSGFTASKVAKATKPPKDQGGWFWTTNLLYDSPAYQSLSASALRALQRILREHSAHAGKENGRLKITHNDFVRVNVHKDSVANAIKELVFKGLIRIEQKGRGGRWTPAPTLFRLTFIGDFEGAPATNEWMKVDAAACELWKAAQSKSNKTKAEKRNKAICSGGNEASNSKFSPLPFPGVKPPLKMGVDGQKTGKLA